EVQLRARALDVAASAQRFTPFGAVTDPMLEVRTNGANLEAASARISRLAVLLDTLRAGPEGKRLIAAGARQAEQALAIAQNVFDGLHYLDPQTARIAAWQGTVPLSFAALGVTDSLQRATTLIRHATDMRELAHDVAPAIRYLRLPAVGDSAHLGHLLTDWETIATSVARYERGEITSTLAMLYGYLRTGMEMNDL